jgi:putative peptidoglycan lipid II flippase
MLKNFRAAWNTKTVNRKIFSAMITVGVMTVISKGLVFVQVLVLAYFFGTSSALDAFFIAYLVPSFAVVVIAQSFNVALVPTYIEVRDRDGQQAAQRLLSTMTFWSVGFLLGIMLLLVLASPLFLPVLGSGFSAEKLALTQTLFLMMLPILLFNGLSTIWRAILNAHETFALAALAPLASPLAVLLALVVVGQTWGVYTVAAGIVAGMLLEVLFLGWRLKTMGIALMPRWLGWTPEARQVVRQYVPMIAGALMMSSTRLVDKAMAAMLGPGSVTSLEFGGTVIEGVLLLGSTALGTALLPYVSAMVAAADWRGLRSTLRTYMGLVLAATIPGMLVLLLFSEPIIVLVFQRGEFTAEDTRLVAQIQAAYALQIPFYFLSILVVRAISALKANHLLMLASFVNMITNASLNYVLIQFFGLVGIALSTSLVYLGSWLMVTMGLYRTLRRERLRRYT